MTTPRLSKDNIREITSWDNICLSACMADFLVDELLQEKDSKNISDETSTILGDMVGKYYGTTPLSRQELKTLFSAPFSVAPIDWQIILGLVLRNAIQEECKSNSSEYKGVISDSKQITPTGFAVLAKKLKVNVEFYINHDSGIISAEKATSSVGAGAKDLPEHKELKSIKDHKSAALQVLYGKGHYDRLITDPERVETLNGFDNAINQQDEYKFKAQGKPYTPVVLASERDKPNFIEMVKAKIQEARNYKEVSTPVHDMDFVVTDVKDFKVGAKATPAKTSPSSSKKTPSSSSYDLLKNQLITDFTPSKDKESEEDKWKKLLNETKKLASSEKNAVGYDTTGKKKPGEHDIFVSKKDQEKLDEQLARKLQQEEVLKLKR